MCDVTPDAVVVLPRTAVAASTARRFLASRGCGAHADAILPKAQLLVSEAVTNAIAHGGPPLIMRVSCDAQGLRIDVRDGNPAPPVLRTAGPDDEHGRGVALIDQLSDAWGVQVDERDGKVVWFRLVIKGAPDLTLP